MLKLGGVGNRGFQGWKSVVLPKLQYSCMTWIQKRVRQLKVLPTLLCC